MLDRQIAALSEAKFSVSILIVLSLVLGFLIGREGEGSISSSENIIENLQSDDLKKLIEIHNTKKNQNAGLIDPGPISQSPSPVIPEEERQTFNKIQKLLDQQVSIDMRRQINAQLTPADAEPEIIKTPNGVLIKPTQEAMSVAITLVDDDGSLIVLDITDPLPLD